MEYKLKGLNELSKQLHDFQVKAGFGEATVDRRMMLIHTEISEAYEAFRKDKFANIKEFERLQKYEEDSCDDTKAFFSEQNFRYYIKDTMEDELIDTLIRLLAFCGERNIDIEFHTENKMKYNHLRGYKYGGKKF